MMAVEPIAIASRGYVPFDSLAIASRGYVVAPSSSPTVSPPARTGRRDGKWVDPPADAPHIDVDALTERLYQLTRSWSSDVRVVSAHVAANLGLVLSNRDSDEEKIAAALAVLFDTEPVLP